MSKATLTSVQRSEDMAGDLDSLALTLSHKWFSKREKFTKLTMIRLDSTLDRLKNLIYSIEEE